MAGVPSVRTDHTPDTALGEPGTRVTRPGGRASATVIGLAASHALGSEALTAQLGPGRAAATPGTPSSVGPRCSLELMLAHDSPTNEHDAADTAETADRDAGCSEQVQQRAKEHSPDAQPTPPLSAQDGAAHALRPLRPAACAGAGVQRANRIRPSATRAFRTTCRSRIGRWAASPKRIACRHRASCVFEHHYSETLKSPKSRVSWPSRSVPGPPEAAAACGGGLGARRGPSLAAPLAAALAAARSILSSVCRVRIRSSRSRSPLLLEMHMSRCSAIT